MDRKKQSPNTPMWLVLWQTGLGTRDGLQLQLDWASTIRKMNWTSMLDLLSLACTWWSDVLVSHAPRTGRPRGGGEGQVNGVPPYLYPAPDSPAFARRGGTAMRASPLIWRLWWDSSISLRFDLIPSMLLRFWSSARFSTLSMKLEISHYLAPCWIHPELQTLLWISHCFCTTCVKIAMTMLIHFSAFLTEVICILIWWIWV